MEKILVLVLIMIGIYFIAYVWQKLFTLSDRVDKLQYEAKDLREMYVRDINELSLKLYSPEEEE